jgi:hypothetical protein
MGRISPTSLSSFYNLANGTAAKKKSAKSSPLKALGFDQKPVTTTPASKFRSRDVLSALGVLFERGFGMIKGKGEIKEPSADGAEGGSKKKWSPREILSTVVDLGMQHFPETTQSIVGWVNKAAEYIGVKGLDLGLKTAQAATQGIAAKASNLTPTLTSVGFNSIDEMLGNGLYTPAPGSMMMTPANTAVSGALKTAGSIATGLGGLYSMYEGGSLVAEANRIGGVRGRQAGSIGGLTAGLGAGMALNALGIGLGPIGWAGILVGGLVGGGLFGSRLGDKDKWKKEGKRIQKLLEQGVNIPEAFRGRMYQTRGLKKSELINPNYPIDFQGWTPEGYINNKFENSQNEADMTYETLAPYAVFAEKRNDWWELSDTQRKAVTDAAMAAGAVRAHHGTVDVDWSKVGDVDQIIASAEAEEVAAEIPAKGQVRRVSPGMYINDRGEVRAARSASEATRMFYRGTEASGNER